MKNLYPFLIFCLLCCLALAPVQAQNMEIKKQIDEKAKALESQIIEWRRHFHQYPELSNREFKTSKKIEEHLRGLGLEVQTGIAHTGVVAILKGGKPGPVVALRADIDGLPVKERVDIPFASKEVSTYNGQEVGVMHACGHDTHIAMLLGAANILSSMKDQIPGTVKFIFQPAEEGAPQGEEGGAKLMVKEGVLENPKVDVAFGLHINSQTPAGHIKYRPGGTMAGSDYYSITVKGAQTHGAYPWEGTDPIVTTAQIINGLQTIVSRQLPLIQNPAVVSVGSIHGGVRNNIIPEEVKIVGTIRTLDTEMQDMIHEKIRLIATKIAESNGATAEVYISKGYPVTYNDPALTEKMLPSLVEAAGADHVHLRSAVMGAEDFSFYAQKVPGLFFFVGGAPTDIDPADNAPHHTPDFYIDESGFVVGSKALCYLTIDYMSSQP